MWPYLVEAGLVKADADEALKTYVHNALMLEQEKFVVLSEGPGLVDFFLTPDVVFDQESYDKVLKKDGAKDRRRRRRTEGKRTRRRCLTPASSQSRKRIQGRGYEASPLYFCMYLTADCNSVMLSLKPPKALLQAGHNKPRGLFVVWQ
jgi:hypothetical protein